MTTEGQLGTPLAVAIQSVVQPKLAEMGWSTGGSDDTALSEYITLMLVNGKTRDQIASELASDLLSLSPDDPRPRVFSTWLFEQSHAFDAQISGSVGSAPDANQAVSAQSAMTPGSTQMTGVETATGHASQPAIPIGPKSMRMHPGHPRNKRPVRQPGRPLHNVRQGRVRRDQSQHQQNRASFIMNGMNTTRSRPNPMGMPGGPNGMMDAFKMYENMSAQMAQMSQMLASTGHAQPSQCFVNPAFPGNSQPNGRSLFDRMDNQGRRGHKPQQSKRPPPQGMALENGSLAAANVEPGDSMEVESRTNNKCPWDTLCNFNSRCTNPDCPYAHQTPAGNPGITVDLSDECSYDVSCKNHKCTAKHHSPAKKAAFQSEVPCRFGHNCKNPHCAFQHPAPPCRYGDSCKYPNCQFTHLETKCKFTPCKNPHCLFKHEDGQRANGGAAKEHVSERRFVDETAGEELILPEQQDEEHDGQAREVEIVT